MKRDKSLYEGRLGELLLIYEIGECKRPRKILDAVRETSVVASVI
jgi:hypothetical protein